MKTKKKNFLKNLSKTFCSNIKEFENKIKILFEEIKENNLSSILLDNSEKNCIFVC